MTPKNKTVILLGATGRLGAYLTLHLKAIGYDVLAVGHRPDDNGFFADFGIPYRPLSVEEPGAFDTLPREGVYAVLNFAGALPASMRGFDGSRYVSSIVQGTLNVLEYCRKTGVDRIVFPQSLFDISHLFGSATPIPADAPRQAPLTGDHAVYVIAKNAAVDLIEHYYATYGLKRFVFRLSRIYHYHPDPFTYTDGERMLISDRYLIYRAMRGLDLELWGDPDRVLETICIRDFQQIIEKALEAPVDGGLYNVGSGGSTLRERIEGIAEVFSPEGRRAAIVPRPDKPSGTQFLLDISRTMDELGYRPQCTWKDYLLDFKAEMEQQRFRKLWGTEEEYLKNGPAIRF